MTSLKRAIETYVGGYSCYEEDVRSSWTMSIVKSQKKDVKDREWK